MFFNLKSKIKKFFFLNINFFILLNCTYDPSYFNLSKNIGIDTGVVVFTYNRPNYFKKVVDALVSNPESQTLPFIFILDGGLESTKEENIKIINSANIKHKFVVVHDSNYGCGRTLIDGRRFMFEWCNFKKIIFFEDDIVISPDYIKLVLNLYKWCKKNYSNVGLVQCFNRTFLSEKNKIQNIDVVTETFGYYWGYCMDKNAYNKIKKILDEHEKNNLIPYSKDNPNALALAKWFEKIVFSKTKIIPKSTLFLSSSINWHAFFTNLINKFYSQPSLYRTGQDFEMRLALWKAGLIKLTTIVTRAKYIGESGTTHNTYSYQLLGYADQQDIQYKNDNRMKTFRVHKTNLSPYLILFDFPLGLNKIKSCCRNKINPTVRRFINTLIENGFAVLIKNAPDDFTNNLYYHTTQHLNAFDKNTILKKIYIIPIYRNKDLESYIELECNQDGHTFLYVTGENIVATLIKYKNNILEKCNGLIIENGDIYKDILVHFDKPFISTWQNFLKKTLI